MEIHRELNRTQEARRPLRRREERILLDRRLQDLAPRQVQRDILAQAGLAHTRHKEAVDLTVAAGHHLEHLLQEAQVAVLDDLALAEEENNTT